MKILYNLAILLLFFPTSKTYADSEYTGVKFKGFPEQYQQYDRYPWEMLEIDEFSKAYLNALDDYPKDQFLDDSISALLIVSEKNRFVSTNEGSFVFIEGCKPHFCGGLDVFVLYDPARSRAWVLTIDAGLFTKNYQKVWLGKPDQKTKNLLKKLIAMRWQ